MTVVDRETAKEEFERFKEAMKLRLDREIMDENERRDVNEDIEAIIQEIMNGRVTVDDEGRIAVHPEEHEPLVFCRPKGHALAVIDKKKPQHQVAQQFALIGAMCNTPPSEVKNLYSDEIDVCATVVSLFFVR